MDFSFKKYKWGNFDLDLKKSTDKLPKYLLPNTVGNFFIYIYIYIYMYIYIYIYNIQALVNDFVLQKFPTVFGNKYFGSLSVDFFKSKSKFSHLYFLNEKYIYI